MKHLWLSLTAVTLAACSDAPFEPAVDVEDAGHSLRADTQDASVDAPVACLAPSTPTLTQQGGAPAGLQFHVTSSLTLTSFTYNSSGEVAEVISLTDDSCNVIATTSTPAGAAVFTINVEWPLTPGVTYRITPGASDTIGFNQSLYAAPVAFPYATPEGFTVTDGYVQCPPTAPKGSYTAPIWFSFSDFRFCPTTEETTP